MDADRSWNLPNGYKCTISIKLRSEVGMSLLFRYRQNYRYWTSARHDGVWFYHMFTSQYFVNHIFRHRSRSIWLSLHGTLQNTWKLHVFYGLILFNSVCRRTCMFCKRNIETWLAKRTQPNVCENDIAMAIQNDIAMAICNLYARFRFSIANFATRFSFWEVTFRGWLWISTKITI